MSDQYTVLQLKKEACLQAYRRAILDETEYIILDGIPLPRDHHGNRRSLSLSLDQIYVRLRAVEESLQRKRADIAEQALKTKIDAQLPRHTSIPVQILGDYLYRQYQALGVSQQDPVDPEEALAGHQRLVLLGAPGAGKSTLLRYLARRAASQSSGPVPIIISLRNYTAALQRDPTLPLREFGLRQASAGDPILRQELETQIEHDQVLWLLDAQDEARDQAAFCATQAARLRGQVVLSSRPIGYSAPPGGWAVYELLPFAAEDIQDFLQRWFSMLSDTTDSLDGHNANWAFERAAWLKAQLAERPHLEPLARIPLLLTFLAVLAGNEPDQPLPDQRSELYQRYVEELLVSREAQRVATAVPRSAFSLAGLQGESARQAALNTFTLIGWLLQRAYYGGRGSPPPERTKLQIALGDYLQKGIPTSLPPGAVPAEVAAAALDFWEQAGILEIWHLQTDQGQIEYIAFRHLTFAEYASARALQIAWQRNARGTWDFLQHRLHHPAWRESLLFLAGMLEITQVSRLIKLILQSLSHYEWVLRRDLRLAIAVLCERPDLPEKQAKRLIQALLKWGKVIDPWRQTIAFALLEAIGERAIPGLIQTLRHRNEEIRLHAAWSLGAIGKPAAIPALIKALQDEDSFVRDGAAGALGNIGDPAAIPALIEALEDREPHVRNRAAGALADIGTPNIVTILSQAFLTDNPGELSIAWALAESGLPGILTLAHALRNENKEISGSARDALGKIGIPASEAVPSLILMLKNEDASTRACAAEALVIIGVPAAKAIPDLILSLQDENPDVRCHSAAALGAIGAHSDQVVTALIASLKDENKDVRYKAAEALGEFGPFAISVLEQALRDKDEAIRHGALWALKKMGEPAIPALIRAVREGIEDVPSGAAWILGTIGAPAAQATPELIHKLQCEDDGLRATAAWALGEIGAQAAEAAPVLIQLLGDDHDRVRSRAAWALRSFREYTAESVPALIQALQDKFSEVRFRAAWALGEIGAPAAMAVPDLVLALQGGDKALRLKAAEALGSIGTNTEASVPALIQALQDEAKEVRSRAAEALGIIGTPAGQAIPVMIQTLQDEDPDVRSQAAKAIGVIGGPAEQVIPALIRSAQDENPNVRSHAAEALGTYGESTAPAIPVLIQALQIENWSVRYHVKKALGAIGAPAIPALIEALRDQNQAVRREATGALKLIGDQAVPALIQALTDKIQAVRLGAADALIDMGAQAVPGLIQALHDNNQNIRRVAAWALGAIKAPYATQAIPDLIQALDDRNSEVRNNAAIALGEYSNELDDIVLIRKILGALNPWAQSQEKLEYLANRWDTLEALSLPASDPLVSPVSPSRQKLASAVRLLLVACVALAGIVLTDLLANQFSFENLSPIGVILLALAALLLLIFETWLRSEK